MQKTLNSVNRISEFASYANNLEISHAKMHLKSKLDFGKDNIVIVNSDSLPNKYWDYILSQTYKVNLTDHEYLTYRYQPKLYCYDKYGTTELWSLLLKVNNMTCAAEFNTKSFLGFYDDIFTVINEILILEDGNIAVNNENIKI